MDTMYVHVSAIWDNNFKVVFQDRWPLKRGSIHMIFSMTGQEKGDLLKQVTAFK
jgi:hypothetical protein